MMEELEHMSHPVVIEIKVLDDQSMTNGDSRSLKTAKIVAVLFCMAALDHPLESYPGHYYQISEFPLFLKINLLFEHLWSLRKR